MITYGFSIQGKSHKEEGKVCQDANYYGKLASGHYIGVVADGVGSAAYAEDGSSTAVSAVFEFCNNYVKAEMQDNEILGILQQGFAYAVDKIRELARERRRQEADFDTTLSVAIYKGETLCYGHVGDGGIVIRKKDSTFSLATVRKKGPDAVSVIPLRAGRGEWDFGIKKDVASVLLCTDGILDGVIQPVLLNIPSSLVELARGTYKKDKVYVTACEFFLDPYAVYMNGRVKDPDEFIKSFIESEEDGAERFVWCVTNLYDRILGHEAKEALGDIRKFSFAFNAMKDIDDDKSVVCLMNEEVYVVNKDVTFYKEPHWSKLREKYNSMFNVETEKKKKDPKKVRVVAAIAILLVIVALFWLIGSLGAHAKTIKGYDKTTYKSVSKAIKTEKETYDKNAIVEKGETVKIETARKKLFVNGKKKNCTFFSTDTWEDNRCMKVVARDYVKDGKKVYVHTFGDDNGKPIMLSKDRKYVMTFTVKVASGIGNTITVNCFKYKKNKYKCINSLSKAYIQAIPYTPGITNDSSTTTSSNTANGITIEDIDSTVKSLCKKLNKKYGMGTIKKIKYKTILKKEAKDSTSKINPEDVPATIATFDAVTADFSLNMLKNISQKEGVINNFLISPDSIAVALAMAENGAAGDTLTEMINTMSPGLTLEEYCTNLSNFNKRITASENVKMHVADSIWIRNTDLITIKDSFKTTNVNYFNAETYLEPFDTTTVDKINNWVKTNTNNMIPEIIQSIDPLVFMYLINAVAFEGEWAKPFNDSQVAENQDFTNQDGSISKVNMLSSKETYYVELKDGIGFLKTYKDANFAFVGILPPAGTSVNDYLNTFTGREFSTAIVNRKSDKDVYIKLPEFSLDYFVTLNDTLQALGIKKAFSDGADFSNMIEYNAYDGAKIDQVLHKTHIEVDRYGTKAAAVTAVIMASVTSIRPEVREQININLDRPYLYGIVDMKTGVPIFIGVQNKM